jgi:nitrite reductase/ring-hydroxylating ferredoxin subunit
MEKLMTTFVRAASLSDLPVNGMLGVVLNGQRIALFRTDHQIYATSNICSHDEAILTEGWLEAEDCTIECPLHGARFDFRDGRALTLPAYQPISVFPTKIEADAVWVEL